MFIQHSLTNREWGTSFESQTGCHLQNSYIFLVEDPLFIPAMESTVVVPTFHRSVPIPCQPRVRVDIKGLVKLYQKMMSIPFHTTATNTREISPKTYKRGEETRKREKQVFRTGLEPATSSLLVNSSRRALPHYSRMYQPTTEEAAGKVDYVPPSGFRDEMK